MIAGIIAGAVVALAVLGLIVYLVRRGDAAIEKRADLRDVQGDTAKHLERERYEHEITKRDLTAAKRRGDVLEALLAAEQESDANADLDPGDVRGRVLREALRWRPPAGDSIPAESAELPAEGESEAEAGAADLRSPTGPDV